MVAWHIGLWDVLEGNRDSRRALKRGYITLTLRDMDHCEGVKSDWTTSSPTSIGWALLMLSISSHNYISTPMVSRISTLWGIWLFLFQGIIKMDIFICDFNIWLLFSWMAAIDAGIMYDQNVKGTIIKT